MKSGLLIPIHALGLACAAADIAIVATMGALNIHWAGWIAVGFFAALAVGIVFGVFPWRGKPLSLVVFGFWVMSALALLGFGFALNDPLRPPLFIVALVLLAAVTIRALVNTVMRMRIPPDELPLTREASPAAESLDSLFR